MPYEFEDLSKDVAKGADDVKKGLDAITHAAEKADEASAKLSDTQRSALQISDKFAASLEKSAKSMSVLGRAGRSASKALGLADGSLRSAASSMMSVGAGAKVAAAGFRNVSSSASSLAQAERDVAGLVREVEGLGDKLKEIKSQDISLRLSLEGADEVDKLISKTKELMKVELKEGKQEEKYEKKNAKADKRELKNLDVTRKKLKLLIKEEKAGDEGDAGLGKDWGKEFAKQAKMLKNEMEVLEDSLDDLTSRKRYIEVALKAKKMEVLEDFKYSLDDMEKAAFSASLALGDIDKITGSLAKSSPLFAAKLKKGLEEANEAAEQLTDTSYKLSREIDRQATSLGDLINKSFLRGKKEALDFAGGLGKSATGMAAAGLAAYYLFQKTGELAGGFADAAVSLSKFGVQASVLGSVIADKTGPSLADMRSELKLTKAESLEFYGVVKEGVNVLGLSKGKMLEMGKALQDTFGGDPTKRLQEYVDLLKEIPTLDTDLKISAKPDDQAAALFALAQSGKVDVAMEAQMAGLAGAGGAEKPIDGAAMLNAQQKTQYWAEKSGDYLVNKMYPQWGPYLAGTAEAVGKISATAIGLAGSIGFMSMLLKGQSAQQALTTAAVQENVMATTVGENANVAATMEGSAANVVATQAAATEIVGAIMMSGKGGDVVKAADVIKKAVAPRLKVRVAKGVTGGGLGVEKALAKMVAKGPPPLPQGLMAKTVDMLKGFGTSVKSAGQSTVGLVKGLSGLTKGLTIAGVATMAVGAAAGWLTKKFEESGNEVGAASANMASVLADIGGFALLGATIGSAVPGIGTAIGALVGTIAGLVVNFGDLGNAYQKMGKALRETTKDFDGKPIQKFSGVVVGLGKAYEKTGAVFNWVKDQVKDGGTALGKFATALVFPQVGLVKMGMEMVRWMTYSKDYLKYQDRMNKVSDELSSSFSGLMAAEKSAKKELEGFQKRTMDSALGLQRSMKGVEQAVRNAKLEMYSFRKEVAMTDVETLSELGGSAEVFMGSLGDASTAAKDKFGAVSKGLEAMENEILKNEKMLPAERRSALQKLHQEEMKAVKEFADSVMQVVEGLYKTPKLVEAGIKRETAKTKMGTFAAAGGVDSSEFKKMFEDIGKETGKVMSGVEEGRARAVEQAEKLRKQEQEARAKGQKEILEMYKKADAAGKKALSGLVDETAMGPKIKSEEELSKAYEKSMQTVKDLTKQEDDLRSQLPEFFSDAAKAMGEAKKKAEQARKDIETTRGSAKTGDSEKAIESRTKVVETEKKLLEQQRAAEEETAEMQKRVADALKKNLPELEGQGALAERYAAYMAAKLSGDKEGADEQAKILGATDKELGKVNALVEKMTNQLNGNVGEVKKQVEAKQKELKAAQDVAEASRKAVGPVNNSVKIAEIMNKNEKEFSTAMAERSEWLNSLVDVADKDVTKAQIELEARKKQVSSAKRIGGVVDSVVGYVEQQNRVAEEELRTYKERREWAKKTLKENEDEEAVLKKQIDAAGAAGKPTEDLTERLRRLQAQTTKTEMTVKDLDDKIEEANSKIPIIGHVVDKTLSEIEDSVEMAGVKIRKDFGDAMSDLAPYTEDVGRYAEEGFKAASEAARMEAVIKKDAIKKSMREERRLADERIAMADTPEQKKVAEEQKSLLLAKEKAEYAKIETNEKKGVVEAAKRSMELKIREVDLAKGGVDAAVEMAEAFDGSAQAMEPLLKMQLKIEKDRLKEMKKAAAKMREETGNSLETRTMELEVVKQEVSLRKKEYDNAKRVIELKKKEVDIMEDVLQTEMDYLQDVGGSFGRMAELQGEILGMERMKVQFAKESLAAAEQEGASGLELMEKQAEVRKAELGYQRKALGAQKSMLDKFIGAAFGGMTDTGARRGMGTDRALMGIEATRVVSPSGLMSGTGGGSAGTIEERMAKAQFSAASGKVGGGMLSGKGPKKAKIEEDIQKATKKTADSTANMDKNSSKKHSLYTSDADSQSIMSSMLSVLKDIKGVLTNGAKISEETTKATEEATKAVKETAGGAEKTVAGVAASEEVRKTLDEQLNLAKKDFKVAKDEFALAKKENRLGKKELEAVQVAGAKVTALEKGVRMAENTNPYAGAAEGIEDYSRVMSGKVMPEIEQMAKDAGTTAKAVDGKAAKKAKVSTGGERLAGGKFGGDKLGGGKFDSMGSIVKSGLGGSKQMGKEMGKSMARTTGAKQMGKEMGKAISRTGGAQEIGKSMGRSMETEAVTPVAASTGMGTMGEAPLSKGVGGTSTPVSPVGGAGAASQASTESITVKGEIKVTFDSKMFRAQMATLVAEVVKTPEVVQAISSSGFVNVKK